MGSDSFDYNRNITNPELIFEGFSRIGSGYSTYQKKDQFRMKVITAPRKLDGSRNPPIYAFKGRIIDEYSPHSLLPDPCDATVASNLEYVKSIASLHTTVLAYENPNVSIGCLVDVTLEPGDGLSIYNLEYCRFLGIAAYKEADLQVSADCYELSQLSFAQGDFLGDIVAMSPVTDYADNARFLPLGNQPTANDIYERLTLLLAETNLFREIRSGEGGDYTVYNAGSNQDLVSSKTTSAIIDTRKPPITRLSVNEISLIQASPSEVLINGRQYDYRLNRNGPQRPAAVGAYQFMPGTIKTIISYFLPLQYRDRFDKKTQDMFAVVSMMNKRSALGNYLMGRDKDGNAFPPDQSKLDEAYKQIALEWAFFQAGPNPNTRQPYKAGEIGPTSAPGNKPLPQQDLQLTDSFYTGINNNKGSSRYGYERAKNDLKTAASIIANDPKLQELLTQYYTFKAEREEAERARQNQNQQTPITAEQAEGVTVQLQVYRQQGPPAPAASE